MNDAFIGDMELEPLKTLKEVHDAWFRVVRVWTKANVLDNLKEDGFLSSEELALKWSLKRLTELDNGLGLEEAVFRFMALW